MLTGRTRLVGLIGDPVADSLSPRMQNAAFAARGLDWAYIALRVGRAVLEPALRGLPALGFAGANVTVPHKSSVLAFCDELEGFAERAGSVNTIVVREGRLLGFSTDGLAVVEAVEATGARVLLLGAGGAAQAVATALLDAGVASVTVSTRDPERARSFGGRLRTVFPEAAIQTVDRWPPPRGDATLVVNATPVRDEPMVEVTAEHTVVDLAYRPDGEPTALVAAARAAGSRVVDGFEVLVRQGAASFELWTGERAPLEVMRAALDSNEG